MAHNKFSHPCDLEPDLKEKAILKDWESKYGTGRAGIEKVLKRYL